MSRARSSHVPVRSCVGCGQRDARASMLRLVRGEDAGLRIAGPRDGGRGAWVHARRECVAGLGRSRGFARSLRCSPSVQARAEVQGEIERLLDSGIEPAPVAQAEAGA